MEPNDYLTVSQVADLFRVSEKTIYKYAPTIPGYFRIGRSILFNKLTLAKHTNGFIPKPAKDSGGGYDPHRLI